MWGRGVKVSGAAAGLEPALFKHSAFHASQRCVFQFRHAGLSLEAQTLPLSHLHRNGMCYPLPAALGGFADMRFNQQGTKQMTAEQKAGSKPHVEKGAGIFAELEISAKRDLDNAKGLDDVFDAIRDLGIISPFECRAYKLETRALFTSHQAAIWALHNRLVRRCDEKGIDVPPAAGDPDLPQPQSGGGSR